MKLQIKNMVCDRCVMVVQSLVEKSDLNARQVSLGSVELSENPTTDRLKSFEAALQNVGFELLSDKDKQLTEQIKKVIIDLVQQKNNHLKTNLSGYLSDKLNQDYHHLSHLFSSIEGTTIEKYYINLKIEKVKELLVYDEFSLNEISHVMHYSSVAHLSAQFKKITGLTPSQFKKKQDNHRVALDKV